MRRVLLALLALCFASQAMAQSFPKPPDVDPYVPITPVFKTDNSHNVVLDSTVTAPTVRELIDIPMPSNTNRIFVGTQPTTRSGFCLTDAFGGTNGCAQAKFRTHVDFSHMAPDDPIRNYGQPGSSHLHCFFGNGTTNAYSTYSSLRHHALTSTAAGTDANGTGYWYPCLISVNPFGDGKNYAIKTNLVSVYYLINFAADGPMATHLPIGLRYVFGYEMDDNWAWLQTILDAANAVDTQSPTHTRYSVTLNGHHHDGEVFYICQGATATAAANNAGEGVGASYYLKMPDGSDPYNGTCNAGQLFYAGIDGAHCWDGKNLWSPGGYKHVIPMIYDSFYHEWVCPSNYYTIPPIILEVAFTQTGWSDRQHWELSSDLSKRGGVPFTAGALYPPGTTFHTDWMFGWDSTTIRKWEQNCIGIEHHIPHECATSVISANERLFGGIIDSEAGAGGRNPQVTSTWLPHINPTDEGYMLVPPAWSGSLTGMHIHH